MPNAANLRATMQAILAHPKHWKQSVWHCNTSHCFAGFAEMLMLQEEPTQKCSKYCVTWGYGGPGSTELHDGNSVRQWLGLDQGQWNTLVEASNKLCDLQRIVTKLIQEAEGEPDA